MLPYWLTTGPYWFVLKAVYWSIQSKWITTVTGLDNIPRKGAVIIAANHLNLIDSPAIAGPITRRRVIFLAKSDYFSGKRFGNRFLGTVFYLIGQIPIDRVGRDAAVGLQHAARLLKKGRILAVHVEGTRSIDGLLYDAKAGFARLALETRATIVPTALIYPRRIDGKREVQTVYGRPIAYSEYKNMKTHTLAKMITIEIQKLSGQTLANRSQRL